MEHGSNDKSSKYRIQVNSQKKDIQSWIWSQINQKNEASFFHYLRNVVWGTLCIVRWRCCCLPAGIVCRTLGRCRRRLCGPWVTLWASLFLDWSWAKPGPALTALSPVKMAPDLTHTTTTKTAHGSYQLKNDSHTHRCPIQKILFNHFH